MSPTPPSKAPAHWQEVAPSVMPCLPRDHPPLPDLIPATLLQPAFPDPFSGWKSTLSSHAHSLSSKRTFWKEHTLAPLSTPTPHRLLCWADILVSSSLLPAAHPRAQLRTKHKALAKSRHLLCIE